MPQQNCLMHLQNLFQTRSQKKVGKQVLCSHNTMVTVQGTINTKINKYPSIEHTHTKLHPEHICAPLISRCTSEESVISQEMCSISESTPVHTVSTEALVAPDSSWNQGMTKITSSSPCLCTENNFLEPVFLKWKSFDFL